MNLRHLSGTIFIIMSIVMIIIILKTEYQEDAFVDLGRCGVDLPPCQGKNIRCINGYCKLDVPQKLPRLSNLQIIPQIL